MCRPKYLCWVVLFALAACGSDDARPAPIDSGMRDASDDGGGGDSGGLGDAAARDAIAADGAAEDAAAFYDAGLPVRPSFVLDLALNDAVDGRAPRRWPLLIFGVAALWSDVTAPIALDETSLGVRVTDADGRAQSWPLTRLTPVAPDLALDADRDHVAVTWALTSAQTDALALGTYTVELSWAGQTSPPLRVEVIDAPTDLDPSQAAVEQARRAALDARLALLQDDHAAAIAAVASAIPDQPNHVGLLTWQALARERSGAIDDALSSAEAALEQSLLDDPAPSEPSSTFELRNRLLRAAIAQETP